MPPRPRSSSTRYRSATREGCSLSSPVAPPLGAEWSLMVTLNRSHPRSLKLTRPHHQVTGNSPRSPPWIRCTPPSPISAFHPLRLPPVPHFPFTSPIHIPHSHPPFAFPIRFP